MKERSEDISWGSGNQWPLLPVRRKTSRRTFLIGGIGGLVAGSLLAGGVAITLRQRSAPQQQSALSPQKDPHLFLEIPVDKDLPVDITASREGIWDLVWSPDGKHAAIWDSDGVRVFDMQSGQLLWAYTLKIAREIPVTRLRLSWSPNGKLLFLANNNTFRALDTESGQQMWMDTLPSNDPRPLSWSPDGSHCALVSYQDPQTPVVLIWNIFERTQVAVCNAPAYSPAGFYQLAWSLNGKQLASINEKGNIQIWPTSGGNPTWLLAPYTYWSNSYIGVRPWISWLPEGDVLASGYFLGEYSLRQVSTGKLLFQKKPFERSE